MKKDSKSFEMKLQPFAEHWGSQTSVLKWEADNIFEKTAWVNMLKDLIKTSKKVRGLIHLLTLTQRAHLYHLYNPCLLPIFTHSYTPLAIIPLECNEKLKIRARNTGTRIKRFGFDFKYVYGYMR